MARTRCSIPIAAVFLVATAPWARAQTSSSHDAKVQAPELAAPERGSLSGQLASVAFGPADVSRGAFALPSPFVVPTERGSPLASVFPAYSPDAGISEWGMGWQVSLALVRTRLAGELDFQSPATTGDELAGPFGRMTRGSDGAWYPVGLAKRVRVEALSDTFVAYLQDGTQMTFGGTAKVTRTRGTYAWNLVEVRTVTGRKTRLDWTANASGRLFLTSMWYGGVGDDYAYRVDLGYESLLKSFQDYRGGDPLALDRRAVTVTARVKHAQTGVFEERWHYEIAYEAEGFGPGFRLASVQQVYRSGEKPPATTYGYHSAGEWLASAQLEVAGTPAFDPLGNAVEVLSTFGQDSLQRDRTMPTDIEMDGLGDLEYHRDYRLARQTSAGVVFEPLEVATTPDPRCYSAPSVYNTPRRLANAFGTDTTHVVDIRRSPDLTTTRFTVCERSGSLVGTTGASSPSGDWVPGPRTRLVDVNRDHKPDVVKVDTGTYRIALNSSEGTTVSFAQARLARLSPTTVIPETVWVHDMNGDGIADLVTRYSNALWVWHGKGNLDFAEGQSHVFRRRDGSVLPGVTNFAMTFVDANKDGLTDVLLSTSSSTYLHMNRGGYFQETLVPGFASTNGTQIGPYVVDVSGSGNPEAVYRGNDPVTGAAKAWGVVLSGPETGLLDTADDGNGTVLRFEYARAAASPGARNRQSVVTRVEVQSSGYDVATYEYDYASPKLHSVGKFLLGFDRVTRVDAILTHTVDFLNEDRYAGVFLASRRHDSNAPSVDAFESKTYEEALFQGIPWKRLKQEVAGFVDAAAATVSEETDYVNYVRDFCAETTTRTTASGVLTVTKTYVQPDAFEAALSCIWTNTVEQGSHADASLDFRHETALTVNSVGLADKVESVAPADRWTLQTIVYRPGDWLVSSISSPGKGSTSFSYEPGTLLLKSVTTPDGVVTEALSRDPLHDGILTLKTTRGTVASQQFFRFDGQERLARTWDDLGSATELNPTARYDYQFATASEPAAIYSSQLVDAARASARDGVDLLTAAGEPIVTASRIFEGWAFGDLVTRSRTTAESRTHLRPTAAATVDPMALDHAGLLSGADEIASQVSSTFGHSSLARTTYHAGVERQVAKDLMLSGGLLRLTSTENGANETATWMDAGKRVLAFDDEASVRYMYEYDALGRLREVTLPDGNAHRASYDGHGRVWRVEREGLPGAARVSIEHVFDSVTGLPSTKRFLSSASLGSSDTLVRSVGFAYDTIGRVSTETHTAAASGATKTFSYYYDGATPAQPALRTTLGLLTGVSGDGFTKTFEYRADGLLSRRVVMLSGWRSVETAIGYLESGVVGSRTVKVYDAGGTQLSANTQRYFHDNFGRLATLTLNDSKLTIFHFQYDANGQIRLVLLPDSNYVTFDYDALTRRLTGSTQTTLRYTAGTTQLMSARGLVASETLRAGLTSVSRAYDYSAQRFLTSSSDALAAYGYGFDGFGLPASITTNGVTKTIVRSGNTLTAGSVVYTFDTLGRTVARGDLALAYGPDGHIASATRGASTWSFVHDEGGQRLLKRAGATPVAAYLEEGYLDATGLTERVQVGGRTIGLLKNGVFTTAATDARGTVLADTSGAARFASPFGARDVRPSMSAAIDYVEKGYDADLGLVRMGVRDYDPQINQFTTPDPFVGEKLEACLQIPLECNLYAYALGDPLSNVDPTGLGTAGDLADAMERSRLGEFMEDQRASLAQESKQMVSGAMIDVPRMALGSYDFTLTILRLGQNSSDAANATNPLDRTIAVTKEVRDVCLAAAAMAGVATRVSSGVAGASTRSGAIGAPRQTEVVQRAMSRAELEATRDSGLLRGGRGGTHYVSDAVNSTATRARLRLALPDRPEVRVTLEVPAGRFSAASRVRPNEVAPGKVLPGGGMERAATGPVPVRILRVDEL